MSFRINKRIITIIMLLMFILNGNSDANEDNAHKNKPDNSPFIIIPVIDYPLLISSSILWGGSALLENEISNTSSVADYNDINSMDKSSVNYSSKNSLIAADIIFAAMIAVPYGMTYYDKNVWGWEGVFEDIILISESLALTGVVNQLVRYSIRRPRPWVYRDTREGKPVSNSKGAFNSFFSGHVAYSFAASGAFSTIYSIRYPDSSMKWLLWAATLTAGTAEGILRVTSGDHFWTDSIVGAAVGISFGIMVPFIHKKNITGRDNIEFIITADKIGIAYKI